MALQYYDLKSSIIQGTASEASQVRPETVQSSMKIYGLNESQAKAVVNSIEAPQGFSLIQGPPGTGKTKTILGIVGAYLTSSVSGNLQIDGDIPNTRRILVCAPSNAAVDELVLRFKAGIIGAHGKKFEPSVVRLGRSDAVNIQVRDLTLEELVDRAVEEQSNKNGERDDNALRERQQSVLKERNALRERMKNDSNLDSDEVVKIDEQIRALNKNIKDLSRQLDVQREQRIAAARMKDSQRRKLQTDILSNAQVICSTLSGSSHKVLTSLKMRFDTVIIDEAAQCVELSALIPLRYGCTQCIMVGDPNQLPPTVLSQAASNLKYEQSLFVRMYDQFPQRVHLLDTQFRMHPDIARFPSKEFYGGKLYNGPRMASITARPWHSNPTLAPYRFFDIIGSQRQSKETKSMYNTEEANFAYQLFEALYDECISQGIDDLAGKVGIISPYKRQVKELRDIFRRKLGDAILDQIDFNTVDGFQGQEKDIIILSCVRAMEDAKGVGFLGDTRRMNVAITRAKSSMWILGNEENLVKNPVWDRLITDAKERKMFVALRSNRSRASLQEQVIPNATNSKNDRMEVDGADKVSEELASEKVDVSTPVNKMKEAVLAEKVDKAVTPEKVNEGKLVDNIHTKSMGEVGQNSKPDSSVIPKTDSNKCMLSENKNESSAKESNGGNNISKKIKPNLPSSKSLTKAEKRRLKKERKAMKLDKKQESAKEVRDPRYRLYNEEKSSASSTPISSSDPSSLSPYLESSDSAQATPNEHALELPLPTPGYYKESSTGQLQTSNELLPHHSTEQQEKSDSSSRSSDSHQQGENRTATDPTGQQPSKIQDAPYAPSDLPPKDYPRQQSSEDARPVSVSSSDSSQKQTVPNSISHEREKQSSAYGINEPQRHVSSSRLFPRVGYRSGEYLPPRPSRYSPSSADDRYNNRPRSRSPPPPSRRWSRSPPPLIQRRSRSPPPFVRRRSRSPPPPIRRRSRSPPPFSRRHSRSPPPPNRYYDHDHLDYNYRDTIRSSRGPPPHPIPVPRKRPPPDPFLRQRKRGPGPGAR